mmetsp:Transcript_53777/g.117346  ORF Transcript_53777/g.117346 Transcript_53777/m.117346 type:complete len:204 (+) Transcript_53777:954-1565(+)
MRGGDQLVREHLSVEAALGSVVHPLAVVPLGVRLLLLVEVEVDSFALFFVLDPHSFKMVAVCVVKNTEAVALVIEPVAFEYAAILALQNTNTVPQTAFPLTVVAVSILVIVDPSSLRQVVHPLARIALDHLPLMLHEQSAYPIALAVNPFSHVSVAICLLKGALPMPLVVFPLTKVLACPSIVAFVRYLLGEKDGASLALLCR